MCAVCPPVRVRGGPLQVWMAQVQTWVVPVGARVHVCFSCVYCSDYVTGRLPHSRHHEWLLTAVS